MKFFIGTYTSTEGKGAYLLTYHADTDRWSLGGADTSIENCSYAARDAHSGIYYLLNEVEGTVRTRIWTDDGGWNELQTLPTFGDAPCFVAVEPNGSRIAIADYKAGYVITYNVDRANGALTNPVHVYDHSGRGPDAARQEGPHAHCVAFGIGKLYSTDLGTDSVLLRQRLNPCDATDSTLLAFQAPPGEGPRHIVFHPDRNMAYLLSELGSKVFVLAIKKDGRLEELQRLSALPEDFEGRSLGGHIALNAAGDRLYVSNRGHDSLAVFEVDGDGRLRLLDHAPTHGQSPRFFHLAEAIQRIVVAHQDGNSVVILEIDPTGRIGERKQTFFVAQAAFIGELISPAVATT